MRSTVGTPTTNFQRRRSESEEAEHWKPLEQGDYLYWPRAMNCQQWSVRQLHPFLYLMCISVLYLMKDYIHELPRNIFTSHHNLWSYALSYLPSINFVDVLISSFLAPFVIIFARVIVFGLTHFFGPCGLWIFPDLFSDSTFLGPFWPLYEWDAHPNETIGMHWRRFKRSVLAEVGLFKRRRGRGKRKSLWTAIKK